MSLPCRCERLAQRRPRDAQLHRVRLVAVEAADRMRDLRLQVGELARRRTSPARSSCHQPRHVGALAGPAGGRRLLVDPLGRRSRPRSRGRVRGPADTPWRTRSRRRGSRWPAFLPDSRAGRPRRTWSAWSSRPSSCRLHTRADSSRPTCAVGFPGADRPQRQPLPGLFAALEDRGRQQPQQERDQRGGNHQRPASPRGSWERIRIIHSKILVFEKVDYSNGSMAMHSGLTISLSPPDTR